MRIKFLIPCFETHLYEFRNLAPCYAGQVFVFMQVSKHVLQVSKPKNLSAKFRNMFCEFRNLCSGGRKMCLKNVLMRFSFVFSISSS